MCEDRQRDSNRRRCTCTRSAALNYNSFGSGRKVRVRLQLQQRCDAADGGGLSMVARAYVATTLQQHMTLPEQRACSHTPNTAEVSVERRTEMLVDAR